MHEWNLLSLTERHGNERHHSTEAHLWLMVMIHVIAIRPQPVFLVVVGVARHTLISMDLLDMVWRRIRRAFLMLAGIDVMSSIILLTWRAVPVLDLLRHVGGCAVQCYSA